VALALQPLLNRLVFHGIEACRSLLDDATYRVRLVRGAPSRINVFTTVAVDRIASDLGALGLQRGPRTATGEDWMHGRTLTLHIDAVGATGAAETAYAVAREYAVLLTRAIAVSDGCSVRVPGLPAQLAVLWTAHLQTQCPLSASVPIEDMIEIVLQRGAIVHDVASAPAELRGIIVPAAQAFVADEAATWALRRALPDARLAPGVVGRARDRFRELAEVAMT
jgi:hypothetical protein